MNERSEDSRDPHDAQLGAALATLLSQRDRRAPAPRFAAMWPAQTGKRLAHLPWRPWLATATAAIVIAGIVWTSSRVSDPTLATAPLDPSLARELSSPDYWRVPTDQLLVYETAAPSVDLTVPVGLKVSLEESLL